MTACKSSLIALGIVVIGCGVRAYAADNVTVVTPPATTAPPVVALAPDGTPVVHKSSHKAKKKSSTAVAASTTAGGAPVASPASANPTASTPKPVAKTAPTGATASTVPAKPAPVTAGTVVTTVAVSDPPPTLGANDPDEVSSSLVPTVETALPIDRHNPTGDSVYSAPSESYRHTIASSLPPLQPGSADASAAGATYSSPGGYQPSNVSSYDNPAATKRTRTYPWKSDIITTEFWIGEPGSVISATDNVASAWDADWIDSNHGSDSPTNRSGYGPAGHAATLNTFYVALPFNDLAYPDQARRWLPAGWERHPGRDGKPVSACKDRWVEIKNEQGDTCYAQWEDVGPLTSDHPEYVFGDERPDTFTRAGLDVSPAVAKYLGIQPEGKNRLTSWRFVEAEDVKVGPWLIRGEEALLYRAIHNLNDKQPFDMDDDRSIQHSSAPSQDPSELDANRKKVGAAKG